MENKTNLSRAQQIDLETIRYFSPPEVKKIWLGDDDIRMFFEWSERGMHKDKIKLSGFTDGFNALVQGKRWRGIHMHELYEPGILSGDMPYYVLLGGYEWEEPPRALW